MSDCYTLFKRGGTQNGIYYAQFRDTSNGKRQTAISTHTRTRDEAVAFCLGFIKQGKHNLKSSVSFASFADGFFDFEKSAYIRNEIKRGNRYSHRYADNNQRYLESLLMPYFKGHLLTEIRARDVEAFFESVEGRYSSSTLSSIHNALNAVMKEAYRLEIIGDNPLNRVFKRIVRTQSKGILSEVEAKTLFSNLSNWSGNNFHFILNALAMNTGMRQGEILALRPADLQQRGESGYINVRYAMDRVYGLKEPKCGSFRVIPLSIKMRSLLYAFTEAENLASEDFVFHGDSRNKPIDYKATNRALYRALAKIGINSVARKERNITFHSWRHYFNTNMRGKISDDKLRLLTGHRTKTMTEHYTYNDFERVQDVIAVQEAVFDKIKCEYKLGYHKAAKMAEINLWAQSWAVSDLSDEQMRAVHLKPYHDLSKALEDAIAEKGKDATIIVLPFGSITVPKIIS